MNTSIETDGGLRRLEVLGYQIVNEPVERVAATVCDQLDDGRQRTFVFLNPHSVVMAGQDPAMRTAVEQASVVFCDGVGLTYAARLLKRARLHRVYGYEFFTAFSRELSRRGRRRVFFLGGQPDSIAELIARYRKEYPGVEVDAYAPPFRPKFSDVEIADMAARIEAFDTDVLWVGLGSPKQEKLLQPLMSRCHARSGAAIGAVFDFYTGRVPHSPQWVRRMGLQWAHRLLQEPARLWKRTFVSIPLFLASVLRAWVRTPSDPRRAR
ncbi:MAG: WecB/TagA/CpsF family glycosyltransferase [Gammaproteobacteria bacterium]